MAAMAACACASTWLGDILCLLTEQGTYLAMRYAIVVKGAAPCLPGSQVYTQLCVTSCSLTQCASTLDKVEPTYSLRLLFVCHPRGAAC